ncbi:MAG: hypothetical protein M1812_003808 [Candelaria pacifica]|nr:MAG: hypothetical protein M1812_003808 [Candelaria pacifica]
MALPLRILTALRISIRQKLALGGIFCLGGIIITFSIVRAVETSSSLTNSWSLKESDPVWLALWSILEASVAVCVSSLPTMRLFFTKTTTTSPGVSPPGGSNTIGSASSNPLRRIPANRTSRRNSHARLPSDSEPVHIHQTGSVSHETKERPMSDGGATVTSGYTTFSEEKRAGQVKVAGIHHPISPTSPPRSPDKFSRRDGAGSPLGFSPIKGPGGGLEHTAMRELEVPGSPGAVTVVAIDSPSEVYAHEGTVFEMGQNTPHRDGSIV